MYGRSALEGTKIELMYAKTALEGTKIELVYVKSALEGTKTFFWAKYNFESALKRFAVVENPYKHVFRPF